MDHSATENTRRVGGACDCHVHVIGPLEQYALVPIRSYTPEPVAADDLIQMMRRVGLDRAVVVQPSVLGTDNRCTLDALPQLRDAGLQARVVAVLDQKPQAVEIDRLHHLGVRGLRVNLQSHAQTSLDHARHAIKEASVICERHGWHVQLFVDRQTIHALKADLQSLPVPVVFDHFAGLPIDAVEDDACQSVLDLLGRGQAWIKLSGTYRVTENPFDHRFAALANRLADVNPEQLVWASDWPHTPKHQGKPVADPPVQPYREIDTARLLALVDEWFDASMAERVLALNPARLYQF